MKFKLITLFACVTVVGVLLAIGINLVNHRKKVEEHRNAFLAIDADVGSLDDELSKFVLSLPAVDAHLQASNPIDPQMALARSVMGESLAFGTCSFRREFHYYWQLEDGSFSDGIRISVAAELDDTSFDDHRVKLTYEFNEQNDEVASWIEKQLRHHDRMRIERIDRRPESAFSEPTSQTDAAEESPVIRGGVR